jgi:hypothetical protein
VSGRAVGYDYNLYVNVTIQDFASAWESCHVTVSCCTTPWVESRPFSLVVKRGHVVAPIDWRGVRTIISMKLGLVPIHQPLKCHSHLVYCIYIGRLVPPTITNVDVEQKMILGSQSKASGIGNREEDKHLLRQVSSENIEDRESLRIQVHNIYHTDVLTGRLGSWNT